jgi:Ca2+-binding RTX toxin-like protein
VMDERGNLAIADSSAQVASHNLDFNWNDDGSLHFDAGREAISKIGTAKADELEGTRRADLLIGGEGNDSIEGKSGNDELSGEAGNDKLSGGSGDDKLYGDRGNDKLDGGSGNDSLWGGSDNDQLKGGSGDDMLSGNQGDDKLYGESGRDRLIGGGGVDKLTGGSGEDTFVFARDFGADAITDFQAGRQGDWSKAFHNSGHMPAHDIIEVDVDGFLSFQDILDHSAQVDHNVVIDFGLGDSLTLQRVQLAGLHAESFVFV